MRRERGGARWRGRAVRAVAVLGLALLGAGTGFGTAPPPAEAAVRAARSTTIVLNNTSDRALVLTNHYLDHGIWTHEPPARIEAGATASWESESNGFMTGTEGSAFFAIDGERGPDLRIHWDNPFYLSNSYSETVPSGYKINRDGGDGNNATATYTFDCNSKMCDGIADEWKQHGVSLDPGDGSGQQFIDLPAMGADVNRPDIFVQVDWMADTSPGNAHSHQFDPAAAKLLVDAFANAPFQRRGATSPGINLHIDAGPGSIMNHATQQTWGGYSRARQLTETASLGTCDGDGSCQNNSRYTWDALDAIKKAPGGFVSSGRAPVFHYAVAAHQLIPGTSWTGISPDGASDLILSLGLQSGQVGDKNQQATDLMHELGHNLGLKHGGFEDLNFKPHYFSVMNYLYSDDGLPHGSDRFVDYSRIATTVDETHLDEASVPASGSGVRYDVKRNCAGSFIAARVDRAGYMDWNCNGSKDPGTVASDVNNDGTKSVRLDGYDDWAHIRLKGGAIGGATVPGLPQPQEIHEPDAQVFQQIQPVDTAAPVTTATADPPPNGAGWNNGDVAVALSATDDLSGVARTEYTLDGGGWTTYTGPVPVTTAGVHTMSYRSVDRAQNTEDAKDLTVRIDRTAPVTTAALGPTPDPAGWITADGHVTLTAVDEPGGSGVASVSYRTSGAQSTPQTTVPGDTAALTITQEGESVITFHARDRAGNQESEKTYTVRLDRTPPRSAFTTASEAIFVAVPAGGPHDDQYVTGTAGDNASGVDHVDVVFTPKVPGPTLVRRAELTCTDGTHRHCTWRVRPPSGLGIHRVTSTATDAAGNVETPPGPGIDVIVVRT
ncbi:OmpL47-type beta-barrel domain-containing protein [Streptomyces rubellomurinus]|uniref:OmpL47-type beta-barrel domain-containing protein n=1 Tax=Streptomyces rubellomurinus (strain ATCC 31215) TaxID=359131 RepID=UPI000A651FD0|nr:hypothetical protein [Streptomyces rubellomurinus]